MKRIMLGSLLSCMLVGQVFGADNDNNPTGYAEGIARHAMQDIGNGLQDLGNGLRGFGKGFLLGSAQTVAPLVISKGLRIGIDAGACVSDRINPLGAYKSDSRYVYIAPCSNMDLIPEIIKKSPMLTSLDKGVGYATILGTLGAWGWNIWSGVQSWMNSESVGDKAKSAGRIAGSSVASVAILKFANLARA